MGDPIINETFIEYAIGMVFLIVRMLARLKFGGLQGLRIDDAFAGAAMVCIHSSIDETSWLKAKYTF